MPKIDESAKAVKEILTTLYNSFLRHGLFIANTPKDPRFFEVQNELKTTFYRGARSLYEHKITCLGLYCNHFDPFSRDLCPCCHWQYVQYGQWEFPDQYRRPRRPRVHQQRRGNA